MSIETGRTVVERFFQQEKLPTDKKGLCASFFMITDDDNGIKLSLLWKKISHMAREFHTLFFIQIHRPFSQTLSNEI